MCAIGNVRINNHEESPGMHGVVYLTVCKKLLEAVKATSNDNATFWPRQEVSASDRCRVLCTEMSLVTVVRY